MLGVKNPIVPKNKPESNDPKRKQRFYADTGSTRLNRWNCPTTETHAFRHLANHNGMQAGIPLEVRAQSMGHTPAMNDSTYKKRKRTQTTIDLLLKSNTNAVDYVHALEEARRIVKTENDVYIAIGELMARIYGKNAADIVKLLQE